MKIIITYSKDKNKMLQIIKLYSKNKLSLFTYFQTVQIPHGKNKLNFLMAALYVCVQ